MTNKKTGLASIFAAVALAFSTTAALAATPEAPKPTTQPVRALPFAKQAAATHFEDQQEAPQEAPAAAQDERTIRIVGPFNMGMALEVCENLRRLDAENHEPITILLTTPGGEEDAGMMIYDTMQAIKSKVKTEAIGPCMSMGALLLAFGSPGMRTAMPDADIMIHEGSVRFEGTYSNAKAIMAHTIETHEKIYTLLAQRSGQTKEFIAELLRSDTLLTPEQALKLGFIDKIEKPVQPPAPPATQPVKDVKTFFELERKLKENPATPPPAPTPTIQPSTPAP